MIWQSTMKFGPGSSGNLVPRIVAKQQQWQYARQVSLSVLSLPNISCPTSGSIRDHDDLQSTQKNVPGVFLRTRHLRTQWLHHHPQAPITDVTTTTTTTSRRSYHGTSRNPFAPFLPEIIIGFGIGAGWVMYRTSQGKPLTPDQAVASQAAYQQLQDDLQRRNQRYDQERNQQSSSSSYQTENN